jgi:hypothetical protein
MANKKKKKPSKPQPQMSPTNYIKSGRARLLPISECWISSDWETTGLCSITVARQHTTGNVTLGIYLVDTYCLGLKNTSVMFSKPPFEYEDLLDKIFSSHPAKERIEYVLAHNIIYGAIAYAEDLGFKPEKDWALSEFILEEDTDDIELMDIEFGKDGKPLFISGPYDNVAKITARLDQSVGKGNYDFLMQIGGGGFNDFDDDDDFNFEDFEEEDDDTIEDIGYEEVKK